MFSILPEFLNKDNPANVTQPNNYRQRPGRWNRHSVPGQCHADTVWGERATVRLPESATQNS